MNGHRQKKWEREDTFAIACVIFAAFVIRAGFGLLIHPVPVSDPSWYYSRALGIVHGLGYSVHGYPTAYWPPGWPYFLAGVIWLFGPSIIPALIVQSLLGALTAGLTFLIGRIVAGRTSGFLAGISFALLPGLVEWSAVLISEPLYTFLWTLATYIWISRPTTSIASFAFAGIVVGLAALVRPSALLFGGVFLIYLLTVKEERKHLGRIAAIMAVTVGCMTLVITPWIVRDFQSFGSLVVISDNGGVSLYEAYNPEAPGDLTKVHNSHVQQLINDPRTEVVGDRLASQLAMQYIVTHPRDVLTEWARNVKNLYAKDQLAIRFSFRAAHFREPQSPPPSDRVATLMVLINTLMYYAVMVFALFGIGLCCLEERAGVANPRWRLLFGMILYNTLIFAILGGMDRYRYPTMPYFAVFFGIGIVAAWACVTSRFIAARIQVLSKP